MSTIEYLESERKKIWEKITELQKEIDKKTSDYEQEAKQASKKCSEFKNKCETVKNEADIFLKEIQGISDSIQETNVLPNSHEIKSLYNEIIPKKELIDAQIIKLESLFESYPTYEAKLNQLTNLAESADESSNKIDLVYTQLMEKKKEIDGLYLQVFGMTVTEDTSGKVTKIPGLRDELKTAFTELKDEFHNFSKEKKEEFSNSMNIWNDQFENIHNRVSDLLPDALTVGLSHAYSEKKKDEIKDSDKFNRTFRFAIFGLIAVSSIPFLISVYLIMQGISLEDAILKLPRIVLSILPLYVPILWVAYSANRKANLSKRLIEEYTHKEVLSKTFEGLSTQIESIKDSEVSADLRMRLLYNILEVSSENPGKLISDYNKSDHPLMDVLDKSMKLANSVEGLARVPGMTKLVKVLERKAEDMMEKEDKRAASGLSVVDKS